MIGNFIRRNKPWSWVLIAFVIIPLFIQMHLWPIYQIASFITPGNRDTWIQFWGSYLGIIPSGIIASLVASNQIKESNKQSEKTRLQEIDRIAQAKIMENWYEVRQSLITIKLLINPMNTDNPYTYDDFVNHMLSENDQIFEHNNYQEIRIQFNNIYRIINIINIDSDEEKLNILLNNLQSDFSELMKWAQLYSYKEVQENNGEQTEEVDALISEQFKEIKRNLATDFLSDIHKLLDISREEVLRIRKQ